MSSSNKTAYFSQTVDKRSRSDMINFLKNHFRYYTMNSWNRSTSYANKVKIHAIPMPSDLRDLAFDVATGYIECPEFDVICQDEMQAFADDTGYAARFNGRSSGYLVIIDTKRDYETGKLSLLPGKDIDQYADFDDSDEWDMSQLKERVTLVQRFDTMCDNILCRFIDLLRNSETKTYTRIITEEHKVLVPINSTPDDNADPAENMTE